MTPYGCSLSLPDPKSQWALRELKGHYHPGTGQSQSRSFGGMLFTHPIPSQKNIGTVLRVETIETLSF